MGFATAFAALVWAAAAPLRQPLCEPLLEERYQDTIFETGTEGHLKAMLREYGNLAADHPGEIVFEYLAGRAHLGRGTRKAIAAMERILDRDPRFAPALRTLAEIHGSAMFGDPVKERAEREQFAALCPGSAIAHRPAPLPERSALVEAAEATPEQIGLALQADHARLLRMRLFDWYTDEEKAEELRAVQDDSWKAWRLLVAYHRRAGETAKAEALLAEMEERLGRTQKRSSSGTAGPEGRPVRTSTPCESPDPAGCRARPPD